MTNTLGVYNPQFYANEGLIMLEKALGIANTVYMGYDEERRSFGKGDTLNIRRPSVFTAQDAPSTAQDITSPTVQVVVDKWKEVKIGLTDRELAFTGQRIIDDHIRPAAYALADYIDQQGALLLNQCASFYETTASWATGAATDMAQIRKKLFDLKAPVYDTANMFAMITSTLEAEATSNAAFSQQQGAGDQGIATQIRGTLGPKYGFNWFANQNTGGTYTKTTASDKAGTVTGNHAINATSIAVAALEASGVFKAGDSVTFATDPHVYCLAADATMTTGAGTFVLTEPLRLPLPGSTVVTVSVPAGSNTAVSAAYHRNFACFVSAPLSTMGGELGAKIAIAQDPVTGLALRSRLYYDGDNSKVLVALDVLFGWKLLDADLCCRILD